MMSFFSEMYARNSALTLFGWVCVFGAIFCIVMMVNSNTQVLGINAWIKPLKFFLSTIIFSWSMAWYLGYLNPGPAITTYNWVVIAVLAFELIYISIQASKGELSHFNVSSSFHGTMFGLMGLAITILTLFTLYIGFLFFKEPLPDLPIAYIWGIRLGIIFFVIFAFEGGMMASRLAHTVGAPDGGEGIRFLNWSLSHGDLRIAHFVGMHALQVLPLVSFFILTSTRSFLPFAIIYLILTSSILIQALIGQPLIKG